MRTTIALCIVATLFLTTIFCLKNNTGKVAMLNDSLPQTEIRQRAVALNNQAVHMQMSFNKDSLKEAENLLIEAIEIDSSYTLAFINLAEIQSMLGQVEEAMITLKRALKGDFNDRNLLFGIGYFYDLLEEPDSAQLFYDKSLQAFEECIGIFPDSLLLMVNQHFIASIAKNDTAIMSRFLKDYQCKYPHADYLKIPVQAYTKKDFLRSLVLPEFREDLRKEIENRHR